MNIQTNLLLFTMLAVCVVALYSLIMVFGVRRLGQPKAQVAEVPQPIAAARPRTAMPVRRQPTRPMLKPPYNNNPPGLENADDKNHDQLIQEYRRRLDKLDETLKALEDRLKAPEHQTAETPAVEGFDVGELRELLSLASSIRDEVSKLVGKRAAAVN
ncbi:MAG: hypothetical protein QXU49_02305 [Candidatus Caldarchaeum sp.]